MELVTGERAAEGAEAQLRGLDLDAFLSQLHTSHGGMIANVAGLGARGLAALREAIPLPTLAQPTPRRHTRTPVPPPPALTGQALTLAPLTTMPRFVTEEALLAKNTRRARWRLRQIREREQRFYRDVNHQIAKALVQQARAMRKALTVYRMSPAPAGTVKVSRRQQATRWPLYQLEQLILHKATLAGVFVEQYTNTS